MWMLLYALCVLRVTPILCAFHGYCPRKEPPPGVLVVSPGSELVLTCGGHVTVDGVNVLSSSHGFPGFPAAVTRSTVNSISHNAVLPNEYISTNSQIFPTSSSPPSVSQTMRAKSDWDGGQMDEFEDEFGGEERGERAAKFRVQWKFNAKDVEGNTGGSTLSLSHVRMSDAGRYSCHRGGSESFTTRVIVTEAPETPHLSCYKKSPSSKIRCEWIPRKPVHKSTSCSLLIRKSLAGPLLRVPCSYSIRRSRCWCALDHIENDKRTRHQVLLCVSSLISNATSQLLSFRPLEIVKPDSPYNVSVQPETGQSWALKISWKPPYTWKYHDRFYELTYEIRYKPLISMHYQTVTIYGRSTRHTITDAVVGQEYEVQVRAKDEYDGHWSDWSTPEYGRSWTEVSKEDLSVTPFPYTYSEGSGAEYSPEDFPETTPSPEVFPHHYLWMMILVIIGLSFAILLVYIIRYKDKCMSKLQSLGVLAQCSDSVHPRPAPVPADIAPAVAERHALLNKDRPPSEVKERSEQELRSGERTEAANFNNSSYFFLHREI